MICGGDHLLGDPQFFRIRDRAELGASHFLPPGFGQVAFCVMAFSKAPKICLVEESPASTIQPGAFLLPAGRFRPTSLPKCFGLPRTIDLGSVPSLDCSSADRVGIFQGGRRRSLQAKATVRSRVAFGVFGFPLMHRFRAERLLVTTLHVLNYLLVGVFMRAVVGVFMRGKQRSEVLIIALSL
jgi:hypothetical protein